MCDSCYRGMRRRNARKAEAPPDPVATRRAQLAGKRERKLLDAQVSRLASLEDTFAALSAMRAAPLAPIVAAAAEDPTRRRGAAVAMLSDLHYGEVVKPSKSTFGNAYNTAISAFRLDRFFAGVEWLIRCNRTWADIDDLVLWFGGDLITGHIHEDLAETALNPIASVIALQPLLVAGVRRLAALGLRITLVCSYGNHGRTTVKKRVETGAEHSYEWLMYNYLADVLAREDVRVVADPTPHQYVEVFGKTLHFSHGDDCRYLGGVGGITIPLNKATDAWNKVAPAHYSHYGHFHQLFDGGSWLVNGSVIGYNAFAMSIKASPEPPQQWFYVLDSKRGRTARSPIWVGDESAEKGLVTL
jgi:hypothetical protein